MLSIIQPAPGHRHRHRWTIRFLPFDSLQRVANLCSPKTTVEITIAARWTHVRFDKRPRLFLSFRGHNERALPTLPCPVSNPQYSLTSFRYAVLIAYSTRLFARLLVANDKRQKALRQQTRVHIVTVLTRQPTG